jgi:hypothetical protein
LQLCNSRLSHIESSVLVSSANFALGTSNDLSLIKSTGIWLEDPTNALSIFLCSEGVGIT